MTRFSLLLSALVGSLLAFGAPAFAEEADAPATGPIGYVVGFTPAVHGPNGRLINGSPVFENDTITTGPSGVVEIRFIDNTHLVLGSRSQAVLDKFVYDKDGKAKAVVFKMTAGAFRFATGDSPKPAYKVSTPTAAIGVRGTKFDVGLNPAASRVTIFEGAMRVCPPHRPQRFCKTVSKPGQTALIENGLVVLIPDGVKFSEHCTGTEQAKICDLFGRH